MVLNSGQENDEGYFSYGVTFISAIIQFDFQNETEKKENTVLNRITILKC